MSQDTELLMEIRDLLHVMAEPALAIRDKKLRDTLREIVGKGKKNVAATRLMDGSKSQAAIVKEVGIDQGQLSKLVKALSKSSLITVDEKNPKLKISVPVNFFENGEEIE